MGIDTTMNITIPFNRSSLCGRELEYIFQTITIGQIAGDQTFSKKCQALLEQTLGVPRALVTQLLVLLRYLFVLGEETVRMDRGRRQRSFGRSGLGLVHAGPFLGTLLVRSWDRADRVHRAMKARGFDGSLPDPHPGRAGLREALFVLGWGALLALFRLVDVPAFLGRLATGGAS